MVGALVCIPAAAFALLVERPGPPCGEPERPLCQCLPNPTDWTIIHSDGYKSNRLAHNVDRSFYEQEIVERTE